jgi:hypothetical protein
MLSNCAGVARKMVAFAYNFVAALEKHFIDGDFSLFMKVRNAIVANASSLMIPMSYILY